MLRNAKMQRTLIATWTLGLAALLTGAAGTAMAQVTVALPTEGDLKATLELVGDIKRGEATYSECQSCHRRDGSGRAKFAMPRLSGQHASVLIKQLMDIRSDQRVNTDMRDYMFDSDLTLQDFADMAAYLEALPIIGNIAKGPTELVARGKTVYETYCVACHGEHGEGRAEFFYPMLASQHYTYLLREIDLILTGQRGNSNPAMPAILSNLSDEDKKAVSAYLSQLPPPPKVAKAEVAK